MADYSLSPQFANLSNLQPLPALDVTRGAALQFQPLQAIQIQSSRPELIAEGIAGAASNIARGALSGITARYEKNEEEEKEKRKFAHELMLYGAKKKSENAEFFEKEEARFISENSGKPGFAKKYAAFKQAYSGFTDRVPERQVERETEPSDVYSDQVFPAKDTELPDQDVVNKAIQVTNEVPLPQKDKGPLAAIPISTEGATAAPALEALPAPQFPPQVVTAQKKQLGEIAPAGEPQQPIVPTTLFETEPEARNAASQLNEELKRTNPDYRIEVKQDKDGFSYLSPVSIRKERLAEEREEKKTRIEEEKLALQQVKEEREAKKAEQEMEIRQQKIKDENKTLADHVETAATSLRELDDIISTIEKNPWSVGRMSAVYSKMPIDTDAAKVRAKLETVGSTVAINALAAMRQASPTGAAVGNASDKDMAMFKATEGSFDPDNLKAEDILPVLREIKRKRQKIYNDASEVLKANNPEYNPPEIKYPKKEKVTQSEKVSVVSPDGKVGKIPKSQLEEALSKGYKLQ
jgi:hypothetical protein